MTKDEPNAKGTILVIDDDIDVRETLIQILEGEGYTVDGAQNGYDGLRYLGIHEDVRLIILDLMMPVMNGWDFCRHRQNDPDLMKIPVLILSAYKTCCAGPHALKAEAYLKKPGDLDKLFETIEKNILP